MNFKTADLCDDHSDKVQIAEPVFTNFGGVTSFSGPISTVKCFEDNSRVREAFEAPGKGRVLVVDGGASTRCALVGDRLAAMASKNGWAGIIVNGCIRDSADISRMEIGVKALATHPLKSVKQGHGEVNVATRFAGIKFAPNQFVYADEDGIIVSDTALLDAQRE